MFNAVFQLFLTISGVAVGFFQRIDQAYMDEEFHVPQTSNFFGGDFSHNEKITTPPGLYLVFAGIFRLLGIEPTAKYLRLANAGLCLPVLYVITKLLVRYVHPGRRSYLQDARLIRVMLLPTIYFFHFLFYTDSLALCLFAAALCLSLHGRHQAASLVLLLCCGVRQSYLVWFGVFVLWILIDAYHAQRPRGETKLKNSVGPYLVAGGSVLAALALQGGLVAGDKARHELTFHLQQVTYCVLVLVLFADPVDWLPANHLLDSPGARYLIAQTVFLGATCIATTSLVHIFVLSDNRHFVFYLWKRCLSIPKVRYIYIPASLAYLAGVSRFLPQNLPPESNRPALLKVAAAGMCFSLAIIPSGLLELRYFTPLLYVFCITRPLRTFRREGLGILINGLLSAALIRTFVFRPFLDVEGVSQRFML